MSLDARTGKVIPAHLLKRVTVKPAQKLARDLRHVLQLEVAMIKLQANASRVVGYRIYRPDKAPRDTDSQTFVLTMDDIDGASLV